MPHLRLKKSLGQHHLRNPGTLRPLLDFLRPAGRTVVEIGPGGGVLTRALLEAGARVWAVELDLSWAAEVARRERRRELSVLAADALGFPWQRLPAGTLVTGNLPYNVATPLVATILRATGRVPRAGFLVQREVAERMVSPPGRRAYGSLSVMVASLSEPRVLGRVPPGAFRPPPKVDSAFVGFVLREPPIACHEVDPFQELVRLGFAHKRKTLRNALAAAWGRSRAESVIAAAGLPEGIRAEPVDLAGWVRLFRAA